MRLAVLIIVAFWCLPGSAQTLQILGSDEGFLPFYYGETLDKGILVEVISEFTLATGIAAEFRPMPRQRQAWALEGGRANAVFANPRWMPLPERMHAVGPVLTWRDRVFAQPGQQPGSFEDLQGRICLRKWFVYSDPLERRLSDDLVRLDAYNAEQMLSLFLHKRCDYAVMNEMEFRFMAQMLDVDPNRYTTDLIAAEWPVYLGILKTETALIEAAEAFFATHTIDEEAMLPNLPPPDQPVSIQQYK